MAWFSGKIDLNSLKNQVANTLKEVLDEDEEDPSLGHLAQRDTSLSSLEAEIESLKASNASLLEEKERESRQMKELLIEKEEEIRELQGWSNSQEESEDASHLVSRIQGLEARLKEVSGRERRESKHETSQTESQTQEDLQDTIQKLSTELLEKSQSFEIEKENKAQECEKLIKELHQCKSIIESLEKKLEDKEIQRAKLHDNKTEETAQLLEVEKGEYIQELQKKIKDLESQRDEFDKSAAAVADMKNVLLEKDAKEFILEEELSKLKEEKSHEVAEVKQKLSELQKELSSQKEKQALRLKELEENHEVMLKEKNDLIGNLRDSISSLESEIQSFKEDTSSKDSEGELETLISKTKDLQEALDVQMQEKSYYEKQVQDLSTTLLKKEDELQERDLCLKEHEKENDAVIIELKGRVVDTEDEVKGFKQALQEVTTTKNKEIESLCSKIKLLEEENALLQSSLAESEQNIKSVQNNMECDLSSSEALPALNEHETIINTLASKEKLISSLEKELQNASTWKEGAFSILEASSDEEFAALLEELLRTLREAFQRLKPKEDLKGSDVPAGKILEDFNEQLKMLLTNCKDLEESVVQFENEKSNLRSEIESKEKMLIDCNQTMESLKRSNIETENELLNLKALKESSFDLEEQLETLRDTLATCEEELSVVRDDKIKLEEQVQSLEKSIKSEKSSVASLKENISSLTDEKEVLLKKSLEDKDKLNEYSSEIMALKSLKSKIEQQSIDASKVIEKLSALVNEKDVEIDSLRFKLDSGTKKSSETSELRNKVNNMLKERQEMIDTLQLKHQESIGYHEEVERLRKVVELKETEISELKDKVIQGSATNLSDKKVNDIHESLVSLNTNNNNQEPPASENDEDIRSSCLGSKDELNSPLLELSRVREERDALREAEKSLQLMIKDKEYDLAMAKKNMAHIEDLLRERENASEELKNEVQQLRATIDELRRETTLLKKGKEDALAVSSGKDRELMELRREVNNLIDKKRKLEQESERLKQHLVAVEDSYTQDAIEYKDREEDLRNKLLSTEEALRISSAQRSTAVQEATQLGGSLGSQVAQLKEERDAALKKYNKLNKEFKEQTKAVDNLQMALDGFRREQENEIHFSQQFLQDKLKSERDKIESKEAEILKLRSELASSMESLAEKQSLMDQLEHKSHIISTLKQEINSREELLKSARNELTQVNQNQNVKVDKNLIKNLVVGYAAADVGKKAEILKIIGTVLDFTPEERKKSGLDGDRWSWFRGSQKEPSEIDQSLATAFVKFLETESSSNGSVLVLPSDNSKQASSKPPTPSGVPSVSGGGHKRSSSNSSVSSDRSSPNLLLNNPSNIIPTFSINRSSSSILKHVLIEEKEKI